MQALLQPVIEWIVKKCLILLGIIVVLVVILWIKSEWQNVSGTFDRLHELDGRIENAGANVAEKSSQFDAAVRRGAQILGELKSLEGVATAAEDNYQRIDAETAWWQLRWVTDQGTKRQIAKEAAVTARNVADSFKKEHSNEEEIELQKELQQAEGDLAGLQNEREMMTSTNAPPMQRLILWTRNVFPTAFVLFLGIVVTPWILKSFIYFCLAPVVDRLPPVRIIDHSPGVAPTFKPSAVSCEVEILSGQELLVHSDFLQSLSQDTVKRTRYFLNWRLPISSALSKMILLTSVRPSGSDSTRVIISSTKDALGEVGILSIPEGGTMVMQPRCLAGVVKPLSGPIRISSEWRIRNLHSWLTLQLRYLVFHGPCLLIVKGCRGVKAEELNGAPSRLIDQSATLGFSAHLDYSNTRCETFIPYLQGKKDLFKDLFAGSKGVFLCEEMPNSADSSAKGGKWIEGFLGGILKIFGL